MCGPTKQEQQIESQNAQFAQSIQNNYSTLFGEQQGVLSNLNTLLSPIAAAGPNQQGFSAAENAALNTQALDTTGANYANAARALNEQESGSLNTGAGESGVQQQLQAGLASSAAGQLSNEQLGITQADYNQGRQNWQTALSGQQALAGLYSPNAAGSTGTSAGSSAFSGAGQIAQQQAQEDQMIGSLVGAGTSALTGGLSNLFTPAAPSMANLNNGGGLTGNIGAPAPSFPISSGAWAPEPEAPNE